MSSKTNFKHTVSTTTPSTAGNLGDEWYNPATNKWYKLLARSGTSVQWTEVNAATSATAVVSSGLSTINGNVTVDGNVIATGLFATGNLTIAATRNIILSPGANSSIIGIPAGGSGLFNSSITNSTNYAANNALAPAITFTAKSILHSVYITNIDSSANANVGVTATISGTTSNAPFLWNMPMPYRSSFEALKKPKIVNAGEMVVTKPNVAHVMLFTKDTVFLNLIRGDRDHENYGITHTIPYKLIEKNNVKEFIKDYKSTCRVCSNANLTRVLSLGYHPLANNLLKNHNQQFFLLIDKPRIF
jgi:hypothetical protein